MSGTTTRDIQLVLKDQTKSGINKVLYQGAKSGLITMAQPDPNQAPMWYAKSITIVDLDTYKEDAKLDGTLTSKSAEGEDSTLRLTATIVSEAVRSGAKEVVVVSSNPRASDIVKTVSFVLPGTLISFQAKTEVLKS